MSYHRPHIMSIDSDAIIMRFGKYPSLHTSAYALNMGESQNAINMPVVSMQQIWVSQIP